MQWDLIDLFTRAVCQFLNSDRTTSNRHTKKNTTKYLSNNFRLVDFLQNEREQAGSCNNDTFKSQRRRYSKYGKMHRLN